MQPAPDPSYVTPRIEQYPSEKKVAHWGEKRKSRPSHDTLENPQNTHNRPPQSPKKDQEAGKQSNTARNENPKTVYLADEEYLVTALVPSDTACLASSPGRIRRTEVWISREEMVDFLL